MKHIQKRLEKAAAASGYEPVKILIVFPKSTFASAPVWSPGPGFAPAIEWDSWYKRDRSDFDLITAVVLNVGPKNLPSHNGGSWTKPEAWTVQLEAWTDAKWIFHDLWDKPHRVTHVLEYHPDMARVLSREPMAGHPAQPMLRYWDKFEDEWGFVPHVIDQRVHLAEFEPWVLLEWEPYSEPAHVAAEIAWRVSKRWNGTIKVYDHRTARNLHDHPASVLPSYPFARRNKRRWMIV